MYYIDNINTKIKGGKITGSAKLAVFQEYGLMLKYP